MKTPYETVDLSLKFDLCWCSMRMKPLLRWKLMPPMLRNLIHVFLLGLMFFAQATLAAQDNGSASSAERKWVVAPVVNGGLFANDMGLLINTEDPYSVKVGEYYIKARGLNESQVLRVAVPVRGLLTPPEFFKLRQQIEIFFGDRVQALALAWRMPYGVECNSITGAITMGFDPSICKNSCQPTRQSPYFGSASVKPYRDYKMRLSMLLAAPNADEAKALIDRGVRADGALMLKGAPRAEAHFVATSDTLRSVRQHFFPPAGTMPNTNIKVYLDETDALKQRSNVLIYMTGSAQVDFLDTIGFAPGALADHLTSFGGIVDLPHGQMTVFSWISAGATATYGTTSEPCAHWQKFPHPQALIGFYAQGATAIESYWKSVVWPQQGLFVGEPLAAPFSKKQP
jgi:uncharacterized protein (TIGR03790 family)